MFALHLITAVHFLVSRKISKLDFTIFSPIAIYFMLCLLDYIKLHFTECRFLIVLHNDVINPYIAKHN